MEMLELDFTSKLVSHGNGGSVMSGNNAGVATLIKHKTPLTSYVHCHAHRLHLRLVDCMKTIPQANKFFVFLENLHVFLSGAYVHAWWIEIQRKLYPTEQVRDLQWLSDTGWACRHAACKAVRDQLSAL